MLSDLRKSINAILFERVTSPFFGTLIISWIIWNWKIIYLTFFISENKISENKIDYILNNYTNIHFLVTFPILSTIILITIIPFASNGAYWLHLKFQQWKIEKKNEVEKNQLLSFEKSLAIRKELKGKEIEFEKLLSDKEEEIKLLNFRISGLEKSSDIVPTIDVTVDSEFEVNKASFEYQKFKKNKKAFNSLEKIVKSIKKDNIFPNGINEEIKEYYLLNDIVDYSMGRYNLTGKGNAFYKEYFNQKFNS